MRIKELNHVALYVKDVEASVRFYRNGLGLEPIPRPAFNFPGAWFRLGEQQELHLIGNRTEPYELPRARHFALAVDDIQKAADFLRKQGLNFQTPEQRPDGIWQIFLQDPDGYFVELTHL